jgi:hypothetical protein
MDIIDTYNDELSIWNIYSIINYVKDNFVQFILLISVFIIIYYVDYINNINMALMNLQLGVVNNIPQISNQMQQHSKLKKEFKITNKKQKGNKK